MKTIEALDAALEQMAVAAGWLEALEEQLDGHPDRADKYTLATVRCVRHALDKENPIVKRLVKFYNRKIVKSGE